MKSTIDTIGVIIGRFQVHELHPAHIDLINNVLSKHKRVIIFLGVSPVLCSKRNPLDFVTRKAMFDNSPKFGPNQISAILPIHDNRNDDKWSEEIDKRIREVFPMGNAILYGSRDSFIPHYKGRFKTEELETKVFHSGTEVRNQISNQVLSSSEFRAGAIYAVYNQYPVIYSCVDIAIIKDDEILLGKKPGEDKYRFIGGFVDINDESDYASCRRESYEETGATVEPYEFVTSMKVDDWRYKNEKDKKIMTRLYKARFINGPIAPADDISELRWFKISEVDTIQDIVFEHSELFDRLIDNLDAK